MSDDASPPLTTDDAALGGRLRLRQPKRGHRFGHDAVLLAAATAARSGDHVVELGAGVGLAGLALAFRVAGARVTLVEIDSHLAALAAENACLNGLADRVTALRLDVTAPSSEFAGAGLMPEAAQHVMANPPFNVSSRFQRSPDAARATAHAAEQETIVVWVATAARLLARGGVLTIIWRSEGLGDLLNALGLRFGALEVIPVHARPGDPAIRVLVRGTKGSKGPLSVHAPLVLQDATGLPAPEAEAILRQGAPLVRPLR